MEPRSLASATKNTLDPFLKIRKHQNIRILPFLLGWHENGPLLTAEMRDDLLLYGHELLDDHS